MNNSVVDADDTVDSRMRNENDTTMMTIKRLLLDEKQLRNANESIDNDELKLFGSDIDRLINQRIDALQTYFRSRILVLQLRKRFEYY